MLAQFFSLIMLVSINYCLLYYRDCWVALDLLLFSSYMFPMQDHLQNNTTWFQLHLQRVNGTDDLNLLPPHFLYNVLPLQTIFVIYLWLYPQGYSPILSLFLLIAFWHLYVSSIFYPIFLLISFFSSLFWLHTDCYDEKQNFNATNSTHEFLEKYHDTWACFRYNGGSSVSMVVILFA